MINTIKNTDQEDRIEIKNLFIKLRNNRKILIRSTIIGIFVGVFLVVFTPRLYKTQVSLLAESSSNSSASGIIGQLGSLSGIDMASLMGIDMGGNGSVALTPDLYPKVVKSTTFLLEILQQEIYFQKKELKITVGEYLEEHTKPSISGWFGYLLNLLHTKSEEDNIPVKIDGEPLDISQANSDLIESLANSIQVNIIKSEGGLTGGESKIIEVSTEQQDPYISAVLTEKIIASLKQYIINYHTNKEKQDLAFIKARYIEARARYHETQKTLADYEDSNVNVILASAKTFRDRLITENALASNLYKGLAQKLEQAQILVQDKTPVFTVIEPAKIPLRKSKPKTVFTIFGLTLIGLFIGICIILWKEYALAYKAMITSDLAED